MGKNVGDDLAEGKLTLPLIYALANGSKSQALIIRESLSAKSADRMNDVLTVVQACGALDYTHGAAVQQRDKALICLEALPDNAYRAALNSVTEFCVSRLF